MGLKLILKYFKMYFDFGFIIYMFILKKLSFFSIF